jgi:opacity protein-like surface antigen
MLLKLASGSFQPYLLGGPGWYKRSVEPIEGPAEDLELSTSEFGWHAGGGAEVRLGRHFGIHGDYRYTFLDFGDDDEDEGFIGGLLPNLPGHRGSMWTLGASVYF